MPSTDERPAALRDIRFLELADEQGQWAGRLAGELGADVIKIEPPQGDAARRVGPFVDDVPHPDRSLYFWHYNVNKRGITLNLETEAGRDLFRRLVQSADVLLESYAPDYLAGLGLDYPVLSSINPSLIMSSLTPFGQSGPWRDLQSSNLVQLALGGPMASCGYDDPTAPPIAGGGGPQAYHIGSVYALIAILGALVERDSSGQGQYIDCAIHDGVATTTEAAVPTWIYRHELVMRHTGRHHGYPRQAPWQFRCADGKYLNTIQPILSLAQWNALVALLDADGLADDLKDERYRDPAVRAAEDWHIRELMGRFLERHPSEWLFHKGQQIDLPWTLVRATEENLVDLHWQDRGLFVDLPHPELGRSITYMGTAYRHATATPATLSRRPPLLGEHNEEVFCGELGLTKEHLAALRATRVI